MGWGLGWGGGGSWSAGTSAHAVKEMGETIGAVSQIPHARRWGVHAFAQASTLGMQNSHLQQQRSLENQGLQV